MTVIKESNASEVMRDLLPMEEVHDAKRAINCWLWNNGMDKHTIDDWTATANWFTPLLYEEWGQYIHGLQDHIGLEADEVWTQILLQFPMSPGVAEPALEYHIDPDPEGFKLEYIAGIALTHSDGFHGGVRFKKDNGIAIPLNPGDAVVFRGDEEHSGGVNFSGDIRYAVYFRYLRRL
jgi:hypothetical protein